MVDKVREKLGKIWDYTPQWKDNVEKKIKDIMGKDGAPIDSEKIRKLYEFISGDAVQELMDSYYKVGEGISDEIRSEIENIAMNYLPSFEDIKGHFGNLKSVSARDLDTWIDSMTDDLEQRLASAPLAKFRRAPVEQGRAALTDIYKSMGHDVNLDHLKDPDQVHSEARVTYGAMRQHYQLAKRHKPPTS